MDTLGRAGKQLFARHKESGHRISARRFYGLDGADAYEREGYVLMTTRAVSRESRESSNGQTKMF